MGKCIYGFKERPRIPWVCVTLHFPRNINRGLRKNYIAKWLQECRKATGLNLAYTGGIFQHGKAHHAHLTVFGINERVGFDILDVDTKGLEAAWGKITRQLTRKAAQFDVKEDFTSWQRYVFEKNTREADDYEPVFHNTRLLKKAGMWISKPTSHGGTKHETKRRDCTF